MVLLKHWASFVSTDRTWTGMGLSLLTMLKFVLAIESDRNLVCNVLFSFFACLVLIISPWIRVTRPWTLLLGNGLAMIARTEIATRESERCGLNWFHQRKGSSQEVWEVNLCIIWWRVAASRVVEANQKGKLIGFFNCFTSITNTWTAVSFTIPMIVKFLLNIWRAQIARKIFKAIPSVLLYTFWRQFLHSQKQFLFLIILPHSHCLCRSSRAHPWFWLQSLASGPRSRHYW